MRACKELIYLYKLFALFFQFVLQEHCKHSPAVIGYRFAKMQRLRHGFHIQIFYADTVISAASLPRLLM